MSSPTQSTPGPAVGDVARRVEGRGSRPDEVGQPLRLAFLGDSRSIHFQVWVNFMAARGNDVTVLLAEGKEAGEGLHPSIKIETFKPYYSRHYWPVGLVTARRSLRAVLKRVRPQVLNAHYLTVNGVHAWVSGYRPYVVTLWGSDILVTPKNSRLHGFLARVALRGARVITVNSLPLERGAREFGARPSQLEMVQWGVDVTRFSPDVDASELRRRLGLAGRRVVLSPRGIGSLYRPGIVLEAFAGLPGDVTLIMTEQGGRTGDVEDVTARIDALGIGDRIKRVPSIDHDEMPSYMALADVVVSVPVSDSTSVAMLEAMATGRQVVAGDLPGTRSWLAELDPELLVPLDDAAATSKALRRALDRPASETMELSRRAREIVNARANQAITLAHVEDIYRAIACGTR